jgi:predicted CopG family antitoxin
MKNIKVDDEVWEKLSRLKLDWKKKRIADVIDELVKCKSKKQ